jgi:hypothetical protein
MVGPHRCGIDGGALVAPGSAKSEALDADPIAKSIERSQRLGATSAVALGRIEKGARRDQQPANPHRAQSIPALLFAGGL